MMSLLRFIGFAVFLSFSTFVCAQTNVPPTPKRPVTDQYHGVKVIDDYRWLEDWANPQSRAWSDSENAHTRSYLDALPGRERLRDQIKTIISTPSAHFYNMHLALAFCSLCASSRQRNSPFL